MAISKAFVDYFTISFRKISDPYGLLADSLHISAAMLNMYMIHKSKVG